MKIVSEVNSAYHVTVNHIKISKININHYDIILLFSSMSILLNYMDMKGPWQSTQSSLPANYILKGEVKDKNSSIHLLILLSYTTYTFANS